MLVKIPNKNLIIDNVKKIQKLGRVPLALLEVGDFYLDSSNNANSDEKCQEYVIDYFNGVQENYFTDEVVFILNNDGNTIDKI